MPISKYLAAFQFGKGKKAKGKMTVDNAVDLDNDSQLKFFSFNSERKLPKDLNIKKSYNEFLDDQSYEFLLNPSIEKVSLNIDKNADYSFFILLQSKIIDNINNISPEKSYSSKLARSGRLNISEKFGEEAFELVTATIAKSREDVVSEAADVLYHMIILLISRGIPLDEVINELKCRTNMSGIEEKAARRAT